MKTRTLYHVGSRLRPFDTILRAKKAPSNLCTWPGIASSKERALAKAEKLRRKRIKDLEQKIDELRKLKFKIVDVPGNRLRP